ncbi:MAG: (Fe-S)-binding protein [Thermodesulfobacteriota bacterium]
MELDINLKELERQFSLCIRCKQCTYGSWPKNFPMCPIYDQYKFFTYSGGGLIYLARGILLGLIEKDRYDEVLKVASKCTSCNYCGQTCKLVKVGPPHQNVTDLIRLLKINLVNSGVYLSEEHKQVIDRVKETKHPFIFSSEEEALKTLKSKVPNKGKILIFSGCLTSYKTSENLKAAIEVLNKAGIDYHMMNNEWCCGAPLLDLGNVDGIAELAEHNLETIKVMGVGKVVFLCPHCQETFQNVYPQVSEKKLDFELIFITKYLRELIDQNVLKPSKSLPYRISYHDPCYLGRYLGDYESARGIFDKIPKISLVEMERNRKESYCCGGGGGAKFLDYDNSMVICQERSKDFKKTGAEVLVTSCPLCKSQFRDLNQSINKKIVIKDTVEVLSESLD